MMPGHLSGNGGVHERKYLKSQHDPYSTVTFQEMEAFMKENISNLSMTPILYDPYSIKGAGGFSSLQGYPFLSALVHPTICGHD